MPTRTLVLNLANGVTSSPMNVSGIRPFTVHAEGGYSVATVQIEQSMDHSGTEWKNLGSAVADGATVTSDLGVAQIRAVAGGITGTADIYVVW